jgi:hypothetical protein
MTDYWLSKLFYDLTQTPALAAEYRETPEAVFERYQLAPEVRDALRTDNVAVLAPRVNAYLLRFYFQVRGLPEPEFIARLHALKEQKEKGALHG